MEGVENISRTLGISEEGHWSWEAGEPLEGTKESTEVKVIECFNVGRMESGVIRSSENPGLLCSLQITT